MRPASSGAVLAVIILGWAGHASAQEASAAGSLGGGVIDDDAAALASAELDLRGGEEVALGLGVRLRVVEGEVLATDWDELSDAGRVLRYFTWRRELGQKAAFSLAAGHLGGVTLGHGSLVRGYASGVDFDRGRAGAELRARVGSGDGHVVIDDVFTAEIIAARAAAPVAFGRHLRLGLSAMVDRPRDVALAGADAELSGAYGRAESTLYVDLASRVGQGAGVHGGVRVGARGEDWLVELVAEGRVSSRGYVPSWVSPMYLRDRDQLGDAMDSPSLAEHADDMSAAGTSWLGELRARTSLGTGSVAVATRPGLPWQATSRVAVPVFHRIQAAAWVVYERGGDAALAAELRARLPRSLFLRAEMARQYKRTDEGAWSPLWLATTSIGAVFGE